MNQPIDKLEFELETEIEGFDPNGHIDGILFLEFMNDKCRTYPDLCDHVALCPCEDDWYDGEQGSEALGLMIDASGDLTEPEQKVVNSLTSLFSTMSKNGAKYRVRITR